MKTPHPHAALIKQWADDPSRVVQFKKGTESWIDYAGSCPSWHADTEYRFKPEPRYDTVVRLRFSPKLTPIVCGPESECDLILTFSGDNWKLIKAEVL